MQTLINIKHTTPGDATYHRSIFYVSSSTGSLAIRNAGESADMKVITLNKLFGRRKVKCLENPHYA
ncbi:MAG: hypothetical protein H6615_10410 [Ignavibacteria bacterium]|nr:hypothetical protein [Ignavibacteria bacterium]